MRRNQAIVMSGYACHSDLGAGEVAYSLASKAGIAAKASKQVARAAAGSRLSDYRKAEDLSSFWYAPTSIETAYWKSAYWLAVASRLGGQGLASSASFALAKGNARLNPIFAAASSFLSSPTAIIEDAGQKVAAVAGPNKQLQAVAKILGVQVTQVEAAQQRAYEQSTPGILVDAFKDSLQPNKWPKWLIPLVIGIPLAVLTLYLLGMKHKVKAAVTDVQRRAKAAVAAART